MGMKSYLLLAPGTGLVKIGCSKRPLQRMLALRTMNAVNVEPVLVFKVPETFLHAKFAEHRHHGEWFLVSRSLCSYLKSIGESDAADRLAQELTKE